MQDSAFVIIELLAAVGLYVRGKRRLVDKRTPGNQPRPGCRAFLCLDRLLLQYLHRAPFIESADQHDSSLKVAVHPGVLGATSAWDSARQASVIPPLSSSSALPSARRTSGS